MKRFLSLLIINIVFCLAVFLAVVFISNSIYKYKPEAETADYNLGTTDRLEQNLPYDADLKSIVTIGCSFVYGTDIEKEDTFAYKLQKLTNRKVYNYGMIGHGPQHVLYKLQHSEFFNQELNPQYIIYVFITDHLSRIHQDYRLHILNQKYLKYKKSGNKLILLDDALTVKPIDYIKISKFFRDYNYSKPIISSTDENFELIKLYLEHCKQEMNKKYPDSKFVVLVYNDKVNAYKVGLVPFITSRWSELEDEGFIVINLNTPEFDFLNDKEYFAPDERHPNGKAWDCIVPIVAKKLNLI